MVPLVLCGHGNTVSQLEHGSIMWHLQRLLPGIWLDIWTISQVDLLATILTSVTR
jgi:hypothetical protein